MTKKEQGLKKQLIKLIDGGNAHATFEQSVKGLSKENRGIRPQGLPYSVWELVEHLRIAQYDILDFSTNPDYKTINWPDDYWPKNAAPKDDNEWQKAIGQIAKDRAQFIGLISPEDADLFTPFDYGDGQNLLREALLIADHNSYHIGQIIVVRRLLNDWD